MVYCSHYCLKCWIQVPYMFRLEVFYGNVFQDIAFNKVFIWPSWNRKLYTGFDLTTHDAYFTILVEVFTNRILGKDTYFMNRIEWTYHTIMVWKQGRKYQIIPHWHNFKTFLSKISTITYFFIKQKFFRHFFRNRNNKLKRRDN